MTQNEFRKLALAFSGAAEAAHMNHPDFRIGGRIFATLGYPDENWAMVKLTPEQQRVFASDDAEALRPCTGVWEKRGATNVHLPSARKSVVKSALAAAIE